MIIFVHYLYFKLIILKNASNTSEMTIYSIYSILQSSHGILFLSDFLFSSNCYHIYKTHIRHFLHLLVQPTHRSKAPQVFLTVSAACPSVKRAFFMLLLFSQLGMSPFSLARPTKCSVPPPQQNTVFFILPLLFSYSCVQWTGWGWGFVHSLLASQ